MKVIFLTLSVPLVRTMILLSFTYDLLTTIKFSLTCKLLGGYVAVSLSLLCQTLWGCTESIKPSINKTSYCPTPLEEENRELIYNKMLHNSN